MVQTLSHCAQEVYAHDRDRFLLSLFVPAREREALLALYALNVELARIHDKISEEMIGHVRYAWWQEALEALYEGQPARGQPVLEALVPVIAAGYLPREMLMPLVEKYREHFPELPPEIDSMMEQISLHLLHSLCPGAEPHWRRAQGIITKHRGRYGQCRNGWMSFKLLIGI